jgi:hypothetical protein
MSQARVDLHGTLQEGGSMLNYLLVFQGVVLDLLQAMKIDYDGEDFGLIVLYPLSVFFFFANFRDTLVYIL